MTTWDASLPQALAVSGAKGNFQDLAISFKPDFGPPLLRKRGTAKDKQLSGVMHMTKVQLQAFEVLWPTYCAAEITFPDPFDPDSTIIVAFSEPPEWEKEGPDVFKVSMKLLVLP